MEFNERLKALRKKAGLTQSDFADKTGVHFQTVSKWERGASAPDISALSVIAKTLNVTLEGLLGVEESDSPITGDFDATSMAKALADYRKNKGLSQSELSEQLDVTPDAVSKWERGVTLPDVDLLIKMSNLFAVAPSVLYYGVKAEETIEPPVFYTKNASKKWMIFTIVLAALFVVSTVCAIIFYPRPEEKINYLVTVQGAGEFEIEGGTLFSQTEPKKSGYRFVKWVNAQGEEVKMPCLIEGEITLSPVFELVEYTIDYWTNGGTMEGDPATIITVESGEITLPIPQKSGDAFLGWYLSNEYLGESITTLSCSYENVTLYAKWETQVFGVRYVLDGGVMTDNPTSVTKDQKITLNTPTKTGYIFLGWYDSASGGNKYVEVGGENAKNLILYALWQRATDTYEITYVLNGGTLDTENPTILFAGESIRLNNPQKVGYDFVGWFDQNNQSANRYEWLTGAKSLTLYAVFVPKEYVIIYNYEGSYVGEPNKSHVTFGESFDLSPVVKEGYDFLGWYDAPENGTKVETINENVISITALYALFKPKTYHIRLNGGGGTFDVGGQQYAEYVLDYVYDTTFILPTCQRPNYQFEYWTDEKGRRFTKITYLNCYAEEFTAHYTYEGGTVIDYQLQGGAIEGDYPEIATKDQVEELPVPVKYGYKFIGWNTAPDGLGDYHTTTENLVTAESITIYAVWEEILIIGTAEDFKYTKGTTQVTLNKYLGNTGEDIDLIIPSFIDGLPVTELGSSFISESSKQLNSIVLPQTLRVIKSSCIYLKKINQPLIIPKSVYIIEQEAFRGTYASIVFEEGSALKTLVTGSFSEVSIRDVFELPEGLEEIQSSSLPPYCYGIKLPQSLKRVKQYALDISDKYRYDFMNIHLPKGVTEVGILAFGMARIYTDASVQTIATYSQNWCSEYSTASEYVLTLKNGDTTVSQQTGISFNLPILTKPGYNFVGWVDENGNSVCKSYINTDFKDVTLYARFTKAGVNDGTSKDNPIIFDGTTTLTLTVSTSKPLYLYLDISNNYYDVYIRHTINFVGPKDLFCYLDNYNGLNYTHGERMSSGSFHSLHAYLGQIVKFDIESWNGHPMSQTFTLSTTPKAV